jgi:hypothetical protein
VLDLRGALMWALFYAISSVIICAFWVYGGLLRIASFLPNIAIFDVLIIS